MTLRCLWWITALLTASWVEAGKQQMPDATFRAELKATISQEHSFSDIFEAEVWLKDMSKRLAKRAPKIPEKERYEVLRVTHREASRFKLNPQLVLALNRDASR